MSYVIEVTRAARRDLAALPRGVLDDIDKCILSLAVDPRQD
jgi:hypothetical protein